MEKNRYEDTKEIFLTKEEVKSVVKDWKSYEDLADLIISKHKSDLDCLENLKKNLTQLGKNDEIQSYRYRIEDDAGEMTSEGDNEEELWGHSHLHLAICFKKLKTASHLIEHVPGLIDQDIGTYPNNKAKYLGLTPFHIAIAHGMDDLVKEMLHKIKDSQREKLFQNKKVTKDSKKPQDKTQEKIGNRMKGTVFMGQLPLQVAVLSYINNNNKDEGDNRSEEVVDILLETKELSNEDLFKANYREDRVFHTIMRFLRCFPGDEDRAVDMMQFLYSRLSHPYVKNVVEAVKFKKKLFFDTNDSKQTALQMEVKFGLPKIFQFMMGMKDVYQIVLPHDDIYEIRRFDVTEIDKVAMLKSSADDNSDNDKDSNNDIGTSKYNDFYQSFVEHYFIKSKFTKVGKGDKGQKKENKSSFEKMQNNFKHNRTQSVSELVCNQPLLVALKMIQADVFETLLRNKWRSYRHIFYFFFVLHVLLLVLMSLNAVAKAHTAEGVTLFPHGFQTACNIIGLVSSMLYFVQEFPLRYCMAKQPFIFSPVHHTIVYRVMLILFATCLFVDSVLNLTLSEKNNWFLYFALVLGTWIVLFFIRVWSLFSTYVVLINEALFKAVFPFASLIALQVSIFSVVFHAISFHPESEEADLTDFDTYGKSLLTMAKLMIGLYEFEELLSTREDFFALFFFVVFVIITFLLMINALIGVMTNRFQETQDNKQHVVSLQTLSVIVFIEGLFLGFRPNWGRLYGREPRNEESIPKEPKEQKQPKRYVLSYRKVPSGEADEPDNIEHALRRERKQLDIVESKVNELLDNQARQYMDRRVLKIYDYSRRYQ